MLVKGSLYITTDPNLVMSNLGTHRVIIIGEPDPEFVRMTDASIGSILIPTFDLSALEMDGPVDKFVAEYMNYLSSYEPTMYILYIIKALSKGLNFFLYLNNDEAQMMYPKVLLQYLQHAHGILVGTPQNNFGYDSRFDKINCDKMYLTNTFTLEEYFIEYPQELMIDNINALSRISVELGININDMNEFMMYVYNMKNTTKNKGKILINPGKFK